MDEEKPGFEERLKAVQQIISGIEEGKLPLEEAVRQYEAGMKELNQLDEELKEMTRRLTILQEGGDGPAERPLEKEP